MHYPPKVAMERIGRQVRRLERSGIFPPDPPRSRGRFPFNPGGMVAKTGGSGIGPMSSTTPASATVTLYDWDGTTLNAGDTVTAYNMTSSAVGANKFVQLKWIQGDWFVDVESC